MTQPVAAPPAAAVATASAGSKALYFLLLFPVSLALFVVASSFVIHRRFNRRHRAEFAYTEFKWVYSITLCFRSSEKQREIEAQLAREAAAHRRAAAGHSSSSGANGRTAYFPSIANNHFLTPHYGLTMMERGSPSEPFYSHNSSMTAGPSSEGYSSDARSNLSANSQQPIYVSGGSGSIGHDGRGPYVVRPTPIRPISPATPGSAPIVHVDHFSEEVSIMLDDEVGSIYHTAGGDFTIVVTPAGSPACLAACSARERAAVAGRDFRSASLVTPTPNAPTEETAPETAATASVAIASLATVGGTNAHAPYPCELWCRDVANGGGGGAASPDDVRIVMDPCNYSATEYGTADEGREMAVRTPMPSVVADAATAPYAPYRREGSSLHPQPSNAGREASKTHSARSSSAGSEEAGRCSGDGDGVDLAQMHGISGEYNAEDSLEGESPRTPTMAASSQAAPRQSAGWEATPPAARVAPTGSHADAYACPPPEVLQGSCIALEMFPSSSRPQPPSGAWPPQAMHEMPVIVITGPAE